ncbi:ATP-binding protein [Streptomyces sp. LX-29]|uniref:ATP-binding protein n=1 Tax=Streptomyces sp. LX-29 TaxID=2900152 RepID=UPI00240D20C5|nr:ATP-binding protein [Streptomyces sp. LX-29]WFB07618.1 ATP-binding protein [Streptomyces sp. LX-29]
MTTTKSRPNAIGAPGYSETLPCEAESVGRARRLVSAALNTWGLDHLIDSGTLIISELVTNATQHSGRDVFRVGVNRPTEGLVRLVVSDTSRSRPNLRQPGNDEETGRGLLIVEALANRWNVDYRRWGKVVWVELDTEVNS